MFAPSRYAFALVAIPAFVGFAQASPITVSANAVFTPRSGEGGMPGSWQGDLFTIQHTSGLGSGVTLDRIVLTLGSSLFFDTAAGGAGAQKHSPLNLGAPPLGGSAMANPNPTDGGNSFGINFTDFDPTESTTFSIDVDRFNPQNQAVGNVNGAEFAGSTIDFIFSGPFDGPLTLTGTFGQSGNDATTSVSQQVFLDDPEPEPTPVPEPATLTVLGLGLGLAGFAARRRRQSAH